MNPPSGRLIVIGTPIGNLSDISPRACQALATADLIAAIDRKEFSLIAWYEPIDRNDKFIMTRWPEEVRKAVYRNYFDSGYLAYTVLYRPKP